MKSRVIALITALLSAAAFTAGCARSKTADLMAPPAQVQTKSVQGGRVVFNFNPAVDIMFVIDHSDSMKDEQNILRAAAARFVDSFGLNGVIDYRVGVISVHDTTECAKFPCPPPGQLRGPFVVRNPEAKEQLREALNIGTLAHGAGGPRFEELFRPILAALDPQMNQTNGVFFRTGARKVIIMVTDEDDRDATLSLESFLARLYHYVRPELVTLYGVVATEGCPRNSYASPPERISLAVQATGGQIFPICRPDFGDHLASIGSDIRRELLRQKIVLRDRPEQGSLILKYGDQAIEEGNGWNFDPSRNAIYINEDLNVEFDPQARFAVEYKTVVR